MLCYRQHGRKDTMKKPTREELIKSGATDKEADQADDLLTIIGPCLKFDKDGRVKTTWGKKYPLGFLRTIKTILDCK